MIRRRDSCVGTYEPEDRTADDSHGVIPRPQEAKMRRATQFLLIAVTFLFMSGCGSQPQTPVANNPPVTTSGEVSLTVTDTPPAGVTVLFFQLGITGATLTSSTGGSVSLLPGSTTIPVNVSQLQTDSAFLGSASVPEGTYTGMSLTFATNPQLTIFNGSGATIGSGASACANNTVCNLTPTTTPLTLTFSSAPFPVALTASTPLGFKLDIHLNTVIQPDLTVNLAAANGVTVSQLPPPNVAGGPISLLGHLMGTVQSVGTNQFALQSGDGRTFSIGVNSSTAYSYPSSVCSADNFSCLATGQIVKVEVNLLAGGTLLASQVSYVQPAGQMVVQGNIIRLSTSGGNTLIDLILQKGPPPPPTAIVLPPFGQRATVTVPPVGVTYAVDSDSFTLPSGLIFASTSNLMVGQQVSVVVAPGSVTTASNAPSSTAVVGPAATTFAASSITLEPSQITGSVSGWAPINVGGLSFTLSTYPNYFVPPAATAAAPPVPAPVNLTIQATSATTFTNLTPDSISGLVVGDVVSVKGWLFPYGAIPQICQAGLGCAPIGEIAAEAVVGRPGPTPLF
jgi:hypothetical protein